MARPKVLRRLGAPVRFDVRLNGKRVAVMGVPGDGGIHVGVSAWFPGVGLAIGMAGTDRGNPVWDRFYKWPAPKVRVGDEVTIRVVRSPEPGRPKFMFKAHRFDIDQMPAPENPTYAVVRNVSVWADKKSVLLRSSDKNRNVPRLTPKAARKVAKALTRAAAGLERRRGKRS